MQISGIVPPPHHDPLMRLKTYIGDFHQYFPCFLHILYFSRSDVQLLKSSSILFIAAIIFSPVPPMLSLVIFPAKQSRMHVQMHSIIGLHDLRRNGANSKDQSSKTFFSVRCRHSLGPLSSTR